MHQWHFEIEHPDACMTGRLLELVIVLFSLGGLMLAFAALTVLTLAEIKFIANSLMFGLMEVALVWGAYLLWIQFRWLCLGSEQPGHVKLWVLIAVEWLVAMACAAGALTAVSALGVLWILGSQFRPAQEL